MSRDVTSSTSHFRAIEGRSLSEGRRVGRRSRGKEFQIPAEPRCGPFHAENFLEGQDARDEASENDRPARRRTGRGRWRIAHQFSQAAHICGEGLLQRIPVMSGHLHPAPGLVKQKQVLRVQGEKILMGEEDNGKRIGTLPCISQLQCHFGKEESEPVLNQFCDQHFP